MRPTYEALVNQLAVLLPRVWPHMGVPGPTDYGHAFWRRLVEGYGDLDVLAERAGLPVVGEPVPGDAKASPVPYAAFLHEQVEVAGALTRVRGAWSASDLAHNAWRRLEEGWSHAAVMADIVGGPGVVEPKPPPVVVDPGRPPKREPPGPMRYAGRMTLTAEGRPYLSTATHAMDLFSLWCRDRGTAQTQLDQLAAAYAAVDQPLVLRVLDTLGYYRYWRGREVTPVACRGEDGAAVAATPGYWDHLQAFLTAVRDVGGLVRWSRGDLQVHGTEASSRMDGILRAIERQADVLDAVGPSVVEVWEACNEATLNGVETPAMADRMVRAFKARHPGVLVAYGAPLGTEEPTVLQAWAGGPDAIGVVHGFRPWADTPEAWETTLRHLFSVRREGYGARSATQRILQMEPFGPGADVSGGRSSNVELLCLAAVLSHLTAQSWTYMSDSGVRWKGPIQDQPGFGEVLRTVAQLPRTLGEWAVYRGGSPENPLTAHPGYWGDPGVAEGPHRVDGATDGTRFWSVVHGGRGRRRIRAVRGVDAIIWDPATDTRQDLRLRDGDITDLTYTVGRVVYGILT